MQTIEHQAAAAADELRTRLGACLGDAGSAEGQLRRAQTTVRFGLGDPEHAVVLRLDRARPELGEWDDECEVQIELTPDQAMRFAVGELPMTAAIATGAVRASGLVRQYLEVDVILRDLLRDACCEPAGSAVSPTGMHQGGLQPSMLAIETSGLHKSFGSHRVLDGLDLQIPAGVISVVLGPSGTGKSVLLQHIIGLMEPDAGDVTVRGRNLRGMPRGELLDLRHQVGVMFQDGALFSAMSIYDNCAFPLRQHTDLPEPVIREQVEARLTSVGLNDAVNRFPSQLSGGMRKRAGLARALMLQPRILLVDEPDSGLDPVRTALLGELLQEQHRENGGTILIVTHNVLLARSIGEHLSVLWRGQVLESGMIDEMMASQTPFVQQFLAGSTTGPLSMDA